MTLQKLMKSKRVFPSDKAAFKQIYLALQNISKKWMLPSVTGNLHWRGL
jgi:transposase-like protein